MEFPVDQLDHVAILGAAVALDKDGTCLIDAVGNAASRLSEADLIERRLLVAQEDIAAAGYARTMMARVVLDLRWAYPWDW